MKRLIRIFRLIALTGLLPAFFAQAENPQAKQTYDRNGQKESCTDLKISIRNYIFTTEKIVLDEHHWIINSVNDIRDVKENLSSIFGTTYLIAHLPSEQTLSLVNNAVPINAIGVLFDHIAISLKDYAPLLEERKITRIEFIVKENTLTRKISYSSFKKENEETVYFLFKTRNKYKETSPNLAMHIPPKQLCQVYLNLLRERDSVSPVSQKTLFSSTTPTDQEIVIDGNSYWLERLNFTPLTFTSTELTKILPFIEGWKEVRSAKNWSKKGWRESRPGENWSKKDYVLFSDFHKYLTMTLLAYSDWVKNGQLKNAEVITSKNIISSYELDLEGKETKMSYYCYKAVSKTLKGKSIFITCLDNLEMELKEN